MMPSKASGSPQERRSGAGWYMGSLTPSQRLVGPVSQTQTNVWELDKGGVLGVSGARGGGAECAQEAKGQPYARAHRAGDTACVAVRVKAPLAPRPLAYASGALAKIFFTFSTTIFFKENVNGY